jgi:NitT/TauT family transport system substrate-binding protein
MRSDGHRSWRGACVLFLVSTLAACSGAGEGGEVTGIRIPIGAGGVGFLPFLVMEEHALIEAHAQAAGIGDLDVRWLRIGGPAVVNDALLSGSADFVAAGPPAFLTLWDRTFDSAEVKGVAAMTSLPMYLNTRAPHLGSLDDLRETDRIALTAPKVSIPALVMQMYARDRYGPDEYERFDRFTVTRTHPDGVIALLAGSGGITAHFTSPPFHQRERQDPDVRTVMTTTDVMGGPTTFTMVSTTRRFRDDNPRVYRAVFDALEEANAMIVADRRMASDLLLTSMGDTSFSADDLFEVVNDRDIVFTTTPENVMRYAQFMYDIGSITHEPASWQDLFFPEIHGAPGS